MPHGTRLVWTAQMTRPAHASHCAWHLPQQMESFEVGLPTCQSHCHLLLANITHLCSVCVKLTLVVGCVDHVSSCAPTRSVCLFFGAEGGSLGEFVVKFPEITFGTKKKILDRGLL